MVNCIVCNENTGKYKCPVCRAQYCSVNCCKKHKQENCQSNQPLEKNETDEMSTPKESKKQQNFVTEDTVPNELLERLRESKKLKEMLKVSDFKKLLGSVDKSENPYKDVQAAMRDTMFTEFVDECLKIVEPIDDQQDLHI